MLEPRETQITPLEVLAVPFSIHHWLTDKKALGQALKKLEGVIITAYTDSSAAHFCIGKGSSRQDGMNALVAETRKMSAADKVTLWTEHVTSEENGADLPSRNMITACEAMGGRRPRCNMMFCGANGLQQWKHQSRGRKRAATLGTCEALSAGAKERESAWTIGHGRPEQGSNRGRHGRSRKARGYKHQAVGGFSAGIYSGKEGGQHKPFFTKVLQPSHSTASVPKTDAIRDLLHCFKLVTPPPEKNLGTRLSAVAKIQRRADRSWSVARAGSKLIFLRRLLSEANGGRLSFGELFLHNLTEFNEALRDVQDAFGLPNTAA
ncbi:hypothetical protein FOZ60_009725 [Perkinsus olseni]|uniref:Uncharacterized protein n=1 Tax=Perkinsus olseni TaxID=32597 RepID=A0A7J6NGW7_PEROL|nr:hypothetical protein FOZ60_009725 [Perkinsus olseni]